MILTLSSESVRNTVFTDERGLPVFKSDTPFRLGGRTTTIHRQKSAESGMDDSEVMGQIAWNFIGSSTFTIDGKTLESNKFLPSHGILGRKRTFTGPDDRQYKWDMHFRDVVLSYDDASQAEVARYHRANLGVIGKRSSAFLEITPEGEHMLDLIILTFIYVEKLRKDKERRLQRSAVTSGALGS